MDNRLVLQCPWSWVAACVNALRKMAAHPKSCMTDAALGSSISFTVWDMSEFPSSHRMISACFCLFLVVCSVVIGFKIIIFCLVHLVCKYIYVIYTQFQQILSCMYSTVIPGKGMHRYDTWTCCAVAISLANVQQNNCYQVWRQPTRAVLADETDSSSS